MTEALSRHLPKESLSVDSEGDGDGGGGDGDAGILIARAGKYGFGRRTALARPLGPESLFQHEMVCRKRCYSENRILRLWCPNIRSKDLTFFDQNIN